MKSILMVVFISGFVLLTMSVDGLAKTNLTDQHDRSPILHAMTSLFVPGSGQFLNGDGSRAIAHFMMTLFVDGFSFTYLQFEFALMLSSSWHFYSSCQAYTSRSCFSVDF